MLKNEFLSENNCRVLQYVMFAEILKSERCKEKYVNLVDLVLSNEYLLARIGVNSFSEKDRT